MSPANDTNTAPKRCLVIMGFGMNTDFATGRMLDLNKSYKLLIKPVVMNKGLVCIRADEILHSGPIDYQMYKELYNADLVIADISTGNVNAIYELGIRHALKKRCTIVISEDKYKYPFDLNHVNIIPYCHLGEAIDYEEVERFREVLGKTIDSVLQIDEPDSPVYSHFPVLKPPRLKSNFPLTNYFAKEILNIATVGDYSIASDTKAADNPTLEFLIEKGEVALHDRSYAEAKTFFQMAINKINVESNKDSYLFQRLAYATYKANLPDVITALNDSIKLLSVLDIERTNDTETVSLAGRIEKRLFEIGQGDQHLANTINFHERCYFLLHNRYHGINLAFLFNKRVDSSLDVTNEERIADMIFASRIRRQVLKMCNNDWNEIIDRKKRMALKRTTGNAFNLSDCSTADDNKQMFWIQVNKAECHYALGEMEDFKKAVALAKEIDHAEWMMKSYDYQHMKLAELMKKHGHLLNPPWSED